MTANGSRALEIPGSNPGGPTTILLQKVNFSYSEKVQWHIAVHMGELPYGIKSEETKFDHTRELKFFSSLLTVSRFLERRAESSPELGPNLVKFWLSK